MAYPVVKITNATEYQAAGEVTYASVFCSDDSYSVNSKKTWEADSRGVCLVKKVTATLATPGGLINAIPYQSSGTSYSNFVIGKNTGDEYEVYRWNVDKNAQETEVDAIPNNYVKPTEKQK